MNLTPNDITTIFKMLGKYAFLIDQVTSFKTAHEASLMSLVEQSMSDHSDECKKSLFDQVIVGLNTTCKRLASASSQAPAQIVENVTKYLKKVVTIMAGMNPQQDVPLKNILFIIRTAMIDGNLYLATEGKLATFISMHLGCNDLPTTGSTLISDLWVTGGVI